MHWNGTSIHNWQVQGLLRVVMSLLLRSPICVLFNDCKYKSYSIFDITNAVVNVPVVHRDTTLHSPTEKTLYADTIIPHFIPLSSGKESTPVFLFVPAAKNKYDTNKQSLYITNGV